MSSSPNVSGIVVDEKGQKVIPASRRPDGSVRKEIKVRPGYIPTEDVTKYTNARLACARKPISSSSHIPGMTATAEKASESMTKSQKKNEKRKLAKKAAAANESSSPTANSDTTPLTTQTKDANADTVADPSKKLKNLKKKLRQMDELKAKQESGEQLNEEQIAKLSSRSTTEAEIAALEKSLGSMTL